jgi:glycosyltransferase involved in cell wall biosynthesis
MSAIMNPANTFIELPNGRHNGGAGQISENHASVSASPEDIASQAVVHCDLSDSLAPPICASQASCRVIIWWHDCPVGQINDTGEPGRTLDRERLVAAVPADTLARAKRIVEQEAAKSRTQPVETSVVICTRDRPDALARCLASFSRQTLRPTQIIVVDNAPTDERTREVVHAAIAEYVREDRPGLDIARNAGARAARGDIVAYTDDDVILHPRWLERLADAFDAPDIMAVTGLVLPAELETAPQRLFETYWGFGRGYRRKDFGNAFFSADRTRGCRVWEIGAGANMAFRRKVFEVAGFFDERLDVGAAGCSGDSEYWHRVLTHGGLCRYEPSAVAYHYHRRDFPGLENQIFHYMRGHSAALLVQFERSGNIGNLRRAFVSMPYWYARRGLRRVVKGPCERDRLLGREVAGFLSGLNYYFRHRRQSGK